MKSGPVAELFAGPRLRNRTHGTNGAPLNNLSRERTMRTTKVGADLAAALLAVAAMQLPDEALAGNKSPIRKADKRIGKGNKGTSVPPSPILPPSPVLPPSPIKR